MTEQQTQLMTDGGEKGAPDYVVKAPTEDGKWVKLGVAFFNPRSESFTIYFDVLPNRQKAMMFKR